MRSTLEARDYARQIADFLEGLKDAEADQECTFLLSLIQTLDSFSDFVILWICSRDRRYEENVV
jgi:hypothetical protein